MTRGRPLAGLQPGDPEQIGPYLIRARVGAGGMGVVYLAEAANGRPVAIKVIQSALAHDHVFRERFRREVAAARRVRSRVTVAVLDADADSENPWVAFEYVEGPNLQDVVEAGIPRMSAAIGILTGIAEALVAIHQVGIIHRDLKPSNVLCPPDGVKVIDFGIAAALEATSMTRTGLMGTPAWLSPEQITGQPLTPAVDVFAWGCIALYTLTGRLAFGGGGEDSPPVLIYRVVNAEPDLSDVPDELIEPVTAALAKQAEDRPTINEILRMMLPSRRLNPSAVGPPADPAPAGAPASTPVSPAVTPAAAAAVAAALGAPGWQASGGGPTDPSGSGPAASSGPIGASGSGAAGPTSASDPPGPGWPGPPPDPTPPPPTAPNWPGAPAYPSPPGPSGPPPGGSSWPPPPGASPSGPSGPGWPSPPTPPPPSGGAPGWSGPSAGATVPVAPPGWSGAPPPPSGPGWQSTAPGWGPQGSPPKKKKPLALVVGIPVAVIVVIVVIALIAASAGPKPKPVVLPTVPSTTPTTAPPATTSPSTPSTTPPGVTPLAQLLPSDVDSANCSHVAPPSASMVGVITGLECSPTNLSGGMVFAFQFDTPADYAAGLIALNAFKVFDPSTAGSACPPGADSQDSIGWHNSAFPSRSGQILECLSVGTNNAQPDYIWTYPTENAVMDAQGADNSTFTALDDWWTKNAPPP